MFRRAEGREVGREGLTRESQRECSDPLDGEQQQYERGPGVRRRQKLSEGDSFSLSSSSPCGGVPLVLGELLDAGEKTSPRRSPLASLLSFWRYFMYFLACREIFQSIPLDLGTNQLPESGCTPLHAGISSHPEYPASETRLDFWQREGCRLP